MSKELFMKWYKSQVISIPNMPVKFMDNTNTVTFKLYNDNNYVTMIIYSSGLIKVLFNDLSQDIFRKSFIHKMIDISNEFLSYLNKKKIYSENPIELLNKDYNKSFDSLISSIVYPIKDYKIELVTTLLENLSSFVRFNKTQETMISCVYKRISDYDSIDSKLRVISLLHNSKRKLKKDEIIEEISKIFNISEEEAIDEYEQWEHLSNGGKIFQRGESGIEFIIDLLGTNLKVDISTVNSYSEFTRIYKFINCVMKLYNDFMESNKDPHNLFKKNATLLNQYNSAEESVDDIDLELMIEASNIVEEEVEEEEEEEEVEEEVEEESTLSKQESEEESTLSKQESKEEKIHSIASNESESEIRLSNISDSELEDSDSSLDLGKLDSESEGGGSLPTKQRGGYNVNRYYLSRLKRYDKPLFDGYSVKKHKSQKQGSQNYTYAGKCGAVIGRQPVAVSKTELDRINATDEGEGVSFYEAVNIDGRNPDIYYMCPKYWDVKDDRPRDPKRVDEFKEHIVNNKMTAQQKKNTDKYILKRDEGGYWDEAGDDITRYKIELWDNFHPKGFKVPCCRAPREGADAYEKGWKVDVLVDVNGKLEWKLGTVESSTKKKVKVIRSGSIETYDKQLVRRHKDSKYITNSFPCNLGSYGHIHPIIKQLVHQDVGFPLISSENNVGLVRKGIKRGSDIGDHSFLDSLQEILSENNSSVNKLRDNIISDLESIPDIYSIGGGSFINKFKQNYDEIKDDKKYLDYIGSQLGLGMKKNDELLHIKSKYKDELKRIKSKGEKISILFEKDDAKHLVQHVIHKYTSIEQFDEYLKDDNEIILDQYVIPVLLEISKIKSKTFGSPIPNLSIVVFEGNSEDVIISPPVGGFPTKADSMILLYKERGHLYEPILYRRFDKHIGIITQYSSVFDDQNVHMDNIVTTIQDKINEYNNDISPSDQLMDLSELTNLMNMYDLPIHNYIYDNYNKIIHVITDDNVLIPVRPSPIGNLKNCIYYPELSESKYPSYNDVIDTLKFIDKHSTFKKYLIDAGLSVVERGHGLLNLEINEIILHSGHYIPVIKEKYTKQKHKLNIYSINSYRQIDNSLYVTNQSNDNRYISSIRSDYKKNITELLFQKVYLLIKENKSLVDSLHKIKHHEIKLRCHKAEEMYSIITKFLGTTNSNKVVILKNELYDISLPDEEKDKLIIRNIDSLTSDIIYEKLLRLFIELFIIYDEQDYDRFLQLDCSLTKIKQLLKHGEILFTYSDIINENYIEHFIRYSQYIRNVSLYGEGITKSKLIQLHRQKDKSRKEIRFVKQYPQIIRTLFGRGLTLVKSISDIELLTKCLVSISNSDEEMSTETIKALLGVGNDYRLVSDDLDLISENYKVGFCLVTQLYTQLLKHDIIIKIHPETKKYWVTDENIPMILLYQYEGNLIHILKDNEPIIRLGGITSELFKKHI